MDADPSRDPIPTWAFGAKLELLMAVEHIGFPILAAVTLLIFAQRKMLQIALIDLGVFLPIALAVFRPEPLAPILGFQLFCVINLMRWARKADAFRLEALTKYGLNLLLGTFLLAAAWQLFQAEGPSVVWPFDIWLSKRGIEILGGALIGAGCFLMIGLAPLQQGLVDLAETSPPVDQIRTNLFLSLGLGSALQAYLPFIQSSFPSALTHLLAVFGLLSICCMRLVGGVQMNIFRSLAYFISALFLPFFVILPKAAFNVDGLAVNLNLFWGLSFGVGYLILTLVYWHLLLQVDRADAKWDDTLPLTRSEKWVHRFLMWDFLQCVVWMALLLWLGDYLLGGLLAVYAVCNLSVQNDRSAYRLKAV